MLWICYTGDYVVDMLQWRLCCGYVTLETVVDMLQWRLCCRYVTMETMTTVYCNISTTVSPVTYLQHILHCNISTTVSPVTYLQTMLWICYNGDYVVDMLQWRLLWIC
jgi:hypothetical protein